jgi:hypothetical protein
MLNRVKSYNVKSGQSVYLSKALPADHSFGNSHQLPKDTKGYITSDGFIAGRLKVMFDTYNWGKQKVEFNELSAGEYLVTDVY